MNPPKVLIIGAENSGKTALFDILVHGKLESHYSPSFSASSKNMGSFWIWDLPSSSRFDEFRINCYSNAVAVLLCYPKNLELFEFEKHISFLQNEIQKINKISPKCKFILVQTKSDSSAKFTIQEGIQSFIAEVNHNFESTDRELKSPLEIENSICNAPSPIYYPEKAQQLNKFIYDAYRAYNASIKTKKYDFLTHAPSKIAHSLKPNINFLYRHLEYAAFIGGIVFATAAIATMLTIGWAPLTITLGIAGIALALTGVGLFNSKKNTGPLFMDTPLSPVLDFDEY